MPSILFGESSNTTAFDWVTPLIQLVTAGGFGAFAWYLVIKHIPTIEHRHREERNEWREYFVNRDNDIKALVKDTNELHQRVLMALTEFRATHLRDIRDMRDHTKFPDP